MPSHSQAPVALLLLPLRTHHCVSMHFPVHCTKPHGPGATTALCFTNNEPAKTLYSGDGQLQRSSSADTQCKQVTHCQQQHPSDTANPHAQRSSRRNQTQTKSPPLCPLCSARMNSPQKTIPTYGCVYCFR